MRSGALMLGAILTACLPSIGKCQTTTTVEVKAYPLTRGGELYSCALGFTLIGQDYFYKQGGFITAIGNFSANAFSVTHGGPITFGLKLIVYDNIGDELVPVKIVHTHLVAADGTVWRGGDSDGIEGEQLGSRLLPLFLGNESVQFLDGIAVAKNFTVAFNRKQEGSDVLLPVNLTVESLKDNSLGATHSDKAVDSFISCFRDLIDKTKVDAKPPR